MFLITQIVEYCYPFVKQKLSRDEKLLREVNYYINVLKRARMTGDLLIYIIKLGGMNRV